MSEIEQKITIFSFVAGVIALSFGGFLAYSSVNLWIQLFDGNVDVIDSPIPINLVIMFVGLVPIIFLLNLIYKLIVRKSIKEELAYFRFVFSGKSDED